MKYQNCIEELIKSIPFPILVFDENNKVILINTVENSLCKWMEESPIGKTVFDLFPNDQASLLHDALLNSFDLKQPGVHPIRLTFSGEYYDTTVAIIPFFNPDVNIWYMICVIKNNSTNGLKKAAVKTSEESIKRDENCLSNDETDVEEAKAALRFLLKEGANQLTELKEETFKRLANQILPHIEGLKSSELNQKQLFYTELLESTARKLAEPYTRIISDSIYKLSPAEIKIASMIREGKSNREMAKILNLSKSTILTHRHHVRVKLGLKNKKQNLQLFLNSFGTQLSAARKIPAK